MAPKRKTPSRTKQKAPRKSLVKRGGKLRSSSSGAVVASDPLLAAYMTEVQKHPLLTREQELELAKKYYDHGDREAFKELVTRNLRFVVKIAHEYAHYRMRLLDLIQEGNTGLVRAVQEFNPYKDVKLTTYAVWWIRSYIQEAILRNYSLVKIGTTRGQRKLFYNLRREQKRLEQEGLTPDKNIKLLASRLDVKEKEVKEMSQRLSGSDVSLNTPISENKKTTHLEMIDSKQESIDSVLGEEQEKRLFHNILQQFRDTLSEREKTFLDQRLTSENPKTLQELGDMYGVSKERARQIEEQIKLQLKNYIQEKFPDYRLGE